MVPDKFNMVDMEGIDIIMAQGEEIPGLYQRLVESITLCRYQCLYNWFFDGILIPPTYVQMEIDANTGDVEINGGVVVDDEDVIHIYSVSPTPEPPVIDPLSVTENGIYRVGEGVDGFNPVTVEVPSPIIEPITITENGVYTASGNVYGYSPITVAVPSDDPVVPSLPSEYQQVEYIHCDSACCFQVTFSKKCFFVEAHGEYDSASDISTCIIGYRGTSTASSDYNLNGSRWYVRNSQYATFGTLILNELEIYSTAIISNTILNIGAYMKGSDSGGTRFKGNIYHVACFSPNRNAYSNYYMPCYRKADNVPGFYDVVEGQFYVNTDIGTPTVGPNVN